MVGQRCGSLLIWLVPLEWIYACWRFGRNEIPRPVLWLGWNHFSTCQAIFGSDCACVILCSECVTGQSRTHPSWSAQLASAQLFLWFFVFRIYMVSGFEEEDSLENLCILSCFAWLKGILLKLLCFLSDCTHQRSGFVMPFSGGVPKMQKFRSTWLTFLHYEKLCISKPGDLSILKPGISENLVPHTSPIARNSAFPISTFLFHSTCW